METTTTQVRLREATRADLAGIWRVRYAVVENTLAPDGIEDDEVIGQLEAGGRGWVVEEDGEIVAFAIGDVRGANVWALFVHPRAEGRGHGSRLHDTMVEWLWTTGWAPCGSAPAPTPRPAGSTSAAAGAAPARPGATWCGSSSPTPGAALLLP